MTQGKVAFVKRVVVSGLPILIGLGLLPGRRGRSVNGAGTTNPPSRPRGFSSWNRKETKLKKLSFPLL